jgi:hypothetical protein
MARSEGLRRYVDKMRAAGRCRNHGVALPCTQCKNLNRKHAATYYAKHRDEVLRKKRERKRR